MTDRTTQTETTGLASRIKPLLPYFVSAALFSAGVWALYHLLAPIHLSDLVAELRATPPHLIALAMACTASGYAALIGYDWSALRYLGKSLPLRVVMTGGFLGYALGNTIGAGPVTGGLVRYRIYSALGLSAYDIAAVATFNAVAFGYGVTVIGFGGLAWYPQSLGMLTGLDAGIIRTVSLTVLALCLAALALLVARRSAISVRGRDIELPSTPTVLRQLVFTALDIGFAGATLYLLLPSSDLGFAPFLAVFATAALAGVLSHIPGGIGVFEAVIIAGLPSSIPLEQAAAALVLYRMVYYLMPFVAAVILLAVTEARRARPGRRMEALAPLAGAAAGLTPLAMSALVFGSGVYMLIAPLVPPLSDMSRGYELLLPLAFVEGGALLSSIIGAVLVVLAHGLLRRAHGAWWLASTALAAGIAASLAHGLDFDRALVLGLALVILLPTRPAFYRTTRLTRDVLGVRWILLMTSIAVSLAAVLFFANKATPYASEMWWQFAADQSAPRALRAALVGAGALALLALMLALKPGRFSHALATPGDLARAAEIIRAQDDPEANIALTGDKSLLFSETGRSFLMYRIRNRSWIALHGPIGDPAEFAELAWGFQDAANAAGGRPVFYAVTSASVPLWLDLGLALYKMSEEAVVSLDNFGLDGSHRKKLRAAHSRAVRDGLEFNVIAAPVPAETMAVLGEISEEWLSIKSGGEKGFSVGRFDAALLARAPIATVSVGGRIVAFANIWQTDTKQKATIDLMRHVKDAPHGVMDFLFTELMLYFKAEGFRQFSLGNAPLSGLEARRGARLSTHLGAFVYRHGRHFYNFEGLRAFKSKFDPDWQPVYIALRPRANMLAVASDAVGLISGSHRGASAGSARDG